jgi:4-alpha-glucanotransferase
MRLERSSGVLLHLTSLPGPHGGGDLGPAAHHFVDWLAAGGQRLWQLLPLNGIGAGNSPYASSSAFAGNVLLIDLHELAAHGWLDAAELVPEMPFETRRVDFTRVVPWRMQRLARAAARFAARAGVDERERLQTFCRAHAHWLDDYALFMALDEAQGGVPWCDWPSALVQREPAALALAAAHHAERIAFWKFCQWRFAEQWLALRRHAQARGVRIVGDAPIFIAWQSADVWARQELFELDAAGRPSVVAGVPPDYFSATGQRWGNPLYRWSSHARDGYAWWIERLRQLFAWVDVVRIDHFRGFAAHWEIAADAATAVAGRWVEAPGDALFDAITRALGPLPIIAEDLGLITPDVEALRRRHALPGMCVLQFAFGAGSGQRYLPHNHEPDSVVYVGTHDNDTARGWWAGASEAERRHAADYLDTDGRDIAWDLMRAACASVADTAILTLQDVLGLGSAARMNVPGRAEGCWEWRFEWSQLEPWHAERLAHLARLYRRDGTPVK